MFSVCGRKQTRKASRVRRPRLKQFINSLSVLLFLLLLLLLLLLLFLSLARHTSKKRPTMVKSYFRQTLIDLRPVRPFFTLSLSLTRTLSHPHQRTKLTSSRNHMVDLARELDFGNAPTTRSPCASYVHLTGN
ncbi:hypothetical protein LZ30DRAFT_186898 [Colletotrichum cereale]|nr:hypothetical protein LZ30DRAFT_186898 [Colletotrichum cereale]